jgi:hypothetical protein
MAGNERELGGLQVAVDDVKVRATDPAGVDADAHLALGRLRRCQRFEN